MARVGRDFLTVCVDLSKLLMPHLLLVFSIDWLQKKQREANPPGMFNLMNMPDEIIFNILIRMPSKTLCRLRCVSKTCLDMVDSPIFTILHRKCLLKFSSDDYAAASPEVPQFVYLRFYGSHVQFQLLEANIDKCRLTQTKNPLPVLKMYMMDTVEFVFYNLFFIKRGALQEYLWCSAPNEYYLVDPLKGEVSKIPAHCSTNKEYMVDSLGMGFDSTTNTYKIVCVLKSWSMINSDARTAHIYELGTHSSSWREIRSVPASDLSRKNVCAYGDMHWLVNSFNQVNTAGGGSRIISFDFKTEEFTWTSHPTLEGLYQDCHLLNIKGSMAMVDTNSSRGENIYIYVMKSYHKKEWALDYKIYTQILLGYPKGGFRYYTCYEWEHGIAFHANRMGYFLNLRYNSMKCMVAKSGFRNTYSFTGSLISLKKL